MNEKLEKLQAAITAIVNQKKRIKATELIVELADRHKELFLSIRGPNGLVEILNTMVRNGEIVEGTVTPRNMRYREKSVYFPSGTSQLFAQENARELYK